MAEPAKRPMEHDDCLQEENIRKDFPQYYGSPMQRTMRLGGVAYAIPPALWRYGLMKSFGTVRYDRTRVPAPYQCCRCRARGVKLWRRYNDFRDMNNTICLSCLIVQFKLPEDFRLSEDRDHVLYWVPAVPTPQGDNFWSYGGVDADAQAWWYRLPERKMARLRPAPVAESADDERDRQVSG